jgi:cytidine deaminase
MKKLSARQRRQLLQRARGVARKSYSPYSHFRVGAAVLTAKRVYAGTNVENASYGLTLCAERSALAAAVAAEASPRIRAVAVACVDAGKHSAAGTRMPCGACRQWIMELAPDAEIIVEGVARNFTIQDLLGDPFTLHPRRPAR